MGYFKVLGVGIFLLFSATASATPTSDPLYVLIGGFHSCRETEPETGFPINTSINSAFAPFRKAVEKTGHPFHWVLTCLDGEPLNLEPELTLAASFLGNKTRTATFKTPFRETMEPVTALIKEALAAAGTRDIYIIGHSYGGWIAMNLVLKLKDDYKIRGLVTLDPISPLHCTPDSFLTQEEGDRGCQEAPTDITPEERVAIRHGAGVWSHLYQKQFYFLHSSAYAEASNPVASQKVHIPEDNPFFNDHHTKMSYDPAVWKLITKQVLDYLR